MSNHATTTPPKIFSDWTIVDQKFVHTVTARTLSIVMTCQWYLLFVHSTVPEKRFSLEYLRYSGSIAVAMTVGLWLVTTKWSRSHHAIIASLLIPSAIAPLFVASNTFYIIFIFGVVIWSYWILLSRQRNTQ